MTPLLVALLLVQVPMDDPVARAHRAYEAGSFLEAERHFLEALRVTNDRKGPLFHDLGNSLYRQGRWAEALWHYRRAKERLPSHPGVRFNLRLVERRLGVGLGESPSVVDLLEQALSAWPAGRWLLLFAGLQTLGLVGALMFPRGSRKRNASILLVPLTLLALGFLGHRLLGHRTQGIVLVEDLAVRSEPHRSLPPAQALRAGLSVTVNERSDQWTRISWPSGSGWVPSATIGVVD